MPRPLVAVLLGTDHHPFDRLVEYAEATTAWTTADWFVQHGFTARPDQLPSATMLGVDELGDLLRRARAVVTHGGPGLIMEARAAGHVPVVVPRDPAYGEHVDDHQLRFTARIARDRLIRRATDLDQFESALAQALMTGRLDLESGSTPAFFSAHVGNLVSQIVHGVS